jgi:hypothetical protein
MIMFIKVSPEVMCLACIFTFKYFFVKGFLLIRVNVKNESSSAMLYVYVTGVKFSNDKIHMSV